MTRCKKFCPTKGGGAPWYSVYLTADGEYVSLGAIEPRFYSELLKRLGLKEDSLPPRKDRQRWPELRAALAICILARTRQQWQQVLEGTDVCFAPVLSMDEAPHHPHMAARGTYIRADGVLQPSPAPRFSLTPSAIQRPPPAPGEHTQEVLRDWGWDMSEERPIIPRHRARLRDGISLLRTASC